jgi:hypothetical protein
MKTLYNQFLATVACALLAWAAWSLHRLANETLVVDATGTSLKAYIDGKIEVEQ